MSDRAATRALVLGVLSLPFGIFAPFAIWTSIRSLRRINESKGATRGVARATAGLAAGVTGLVAFLFGTAYWFLSS
jgi:hypothetical protein